MPPRSHAEARARLLREATRLIAAGADVDLDAVLDALADCARTVLGADSALVNLAAPGTGDFVRRRPNPFVPPDHPLARVGEQFAPDALTASAVARRRPVLIADFHGDPRISPAAKAAMPRVVMSLTLPLVTGEAVVGVLFAHWMQRRALASEDLAVVEVLGRHAAAAIDLAARRSRDADRGAGDSSAGRDDRRPAG